MTWWRAYILFLLVVIAFGTRLPLFLISPQWFLLPVAATYDSQRQEITLTRETPASRRYDWLRTHAHYSIEASLLSRPPRTCEGPEGVTEYEVIGADDDPAPPRDTTVLDASWIVPCMDGWDTAYRVAYQIEVEIVGGVLGGARVRLPRTVYFETRFHGARHEIESRLDRIEDAIGDL